MDSKLHTTKDLGENGQIKHFLKHGQHLTSLIWKSLSKPQEHSLSETPLSFFVTSFFRICALVYESYQIMFHGSEPPNSSLSRSPFSFSLMAVQFHF